MASNQTFQDLLKGVGSVVTSGIGAYLALLLKDRFDKRGQSRTADLEEYKKVTSFLTERVIAALDNPDFLGGTLQSEFWGQLNDLLGAYEAKRELIFHDQHLNARFHAIRNLTAGFVEAVAQYTVNEGNPPRMTTRPRADRVYPSDESRKRSAEEAGMLDRAAKQLGARSRELVDDAKRRLRT
ncbi:hypothetical protein [Paraburkholderia dioscoreae]|uniref:Uncharacterized protein n=1 Tax=Paraburkholderia dioscoreae TaxID=2604047 RepID=A0A5Q4ZET4_9BURK|nr:hypothetical protein [Paraburkholderia dioscoreae]VVD29969.1 conserved protein of unknown function [Paraburkholderia dioscoreae]